MNHYLFWDSRCFINHMLLDKINSCLFVVVSFDSAVCVGLISVSLLKRQYVSEVFKSLMNLLAFYQTTNHAIIKL